MMFSQDGITILDRTMRKNEIRLIKSPVEVLGFNIKNKTGQHLFIEPIFDERGDGNLYQLNIYIDKLYNEENKL